MVPGTALSKANTELGAHPLSMMLMRAGRFDGFCDGVV
jgi:hypothetical protein